MSETSRVFFTSDARPFSGSDLMQGKLCPQPQGRSMPEATRVFFTSVEDRSVGAMLRSPGSFLPRENYLNAFEYLFNSFSTNARSTSKAFRYVSFFRGSNKERILRPWADVICLSQYRGRFCPKQRECSLRASKTVLWERYFKERTLSSVLRGFTSHGFQPPAIEKPGST